MSRPVDDGEVAHLETAWAVRIEECGGADAIGADYRFESGECDVEARWLRRLWSEEAELDFGFTPGISGEAERDDGGLRRIRSQFELKKLEEEFAIAGRDRGLDAAFVCGRAFELHLDGYGGEREGAVGGATDKITDHVCANEEERVELLYGGFEFDVLFEFELLFEGLEGVVSAATREGEPLSGWLAEAGDHLFFG